MLRYENYTVFIITVKSQDAALVDYSYWFGDTVASGRSHGLRVSSFNRCLRQYKYVNGLAV